MANSSNSQCSTQQIATVAPKQSNKSNRKRSPQSYSLTNRTTTQKRTLAPTTKREQKSLRVPCKILQLVILHVLWTVLRGISLRCLLSTYSQTPSNVKKVKPIVKAKFIGLLLITYWRRMIWTRSTLDRLVERRWLLVPRIWAKMMPILIWPILIILIIFTRRLLASRRNSFQTHLWAVTHNSKASKTMISRFKRIKTRRFSV